MSDTAGAAGAQEARGKQQARTRQYSSRSQCTSNRGSRRAPTGTLATAPGSSKTTQQHMPLSPPITAALPRHKDRARKVALEENKGLQIETAKGGEASD